MIEKETKRTGDMINFNTLQSDRQILGCGFRGSDAWSVNVKDQHEQSDE